MAELGEHVWIVAMWVSFGAFSRGDPAYAEQELRPSYDALGRLGEKSHFSSITHSLGTALYLQGRLDEALRMTRECEEACRPNDVHSGIVWRSLRAKILARTGSLEEAERLGTAAVALGATSDFLIARAQSNLDLAEVLALAGQHEQSAVCVAEAQRSSCSRA